MLEKVLQTLTPSSRFWNLINNVRFVMAINFVCKLKNLHITFHKVKAHNGDIMNEKVDLLAKNALHSPFLLNLTQHDLGLDLISHWQYFSLERKHRDLVKSLNCMNTEAEWATLSCNREQFFNTMAIDIKWDLM